MVDGLLEIYNLMNQDIPTNANLDISLICEAILLCHNKIEGDLPHGLRIHADNAASETKNQVAFKAGAVLLNLKIFDVVSFTYFQTGHSHGLPDQRFSEVRNLLFQQATLQCPDDFIQCLKKVKPRQQRELEVRQVQCLEDWHKFTQPLEITLHKHTTTHKMKKSGQHACHYFLMMTREKYATFGDIGMIENFEDESPHPKDVVLVVKSHLSSDDIAQNPFVFLPASALEKLEGFPEYTVPLKKMGKDTVAEMNKTIEKIIQRPWCMNEAAAYLRQLIQQQGTVPQPSRASHPLEELKTRLAGHSKPDQSVFKASPLMILTRLFGKTDPNLDKQF